MRKNLLTVKSDAAPAAAVGLGDYARRGASRSMMLSIDEMAENAKKALSGEAVIELDSALVDPSFLRDRVEDDEASFVALKESVAAQGQLQPVLVRPHPEKAGRYMLVFGHRRARAARELGLPVRAIVKNIEEINHIIVQGQENSRRADLTYIERCLLARKLLEMSHSKETIRAALGIDDTTLSRMVSLVSSLPNPVIDAIGAAKGVGRDRWEALKKALLPPRHAQAALERLAAPEFLALAGAARVDDLIAFAHKRRPARRPTRDVLAVRAAGGEPIAEISASRRDVNLKLETAEGPGFARFLQARLPDLWMEFARVQRKET